MCHGKSSAWFSRIWGGRSFLAQIRSVEFIGPLFAGPGIKVKASSLNPMGHKHPHRVRIVRIDVEDVSLA